MRISDIIAINRLKDFNEQAIKKKNVMTFLKLLSKIKKYNYLSVFKLKYKIVKQYKLIRQSTTIYK